MTGTGSAARTARAYPWLLEMPTRRQASSMDIIADVRRRYSST
ncbi:MAG: hypothetical protein RL531_189 [Actinomycetota bacterium]